MQLRLECVRSDHRNPTGATGGAGTIELDTSRDRNGNFDPQTVQKGQRRLDGIDRLVIGLYARGMTTRDVQTQLKDAFDLDVSPDLTTPSVR